MKKILLAAMCFMSMASAMDQLPDIYLIIKSPGHQVNINDIRGRRSGGHSITETKTVSFLDINSGEEKGYGVTTEAKGYAYCIYRRINDNETEQTVYNRAFQRAGENWPKDIYGIHLQPYVIEFIQILNNNQ